MMKKCKFEVKVTYNPNFFGEGEIKETIKKSLKDLNDEKENKFGRNCMIIPGQFNRGLSSNVNTIKFIYEQEQEHTIVETLVSLKNDFDNDLYNTSPSIVLPEENNSKLYVEA